MFDWNIIFISFFPYWVVFYGFLGYAAASVKFCCADNNNKNNIYTYTYIVTGALTCTACVCVWKHYLYINSYVCMCMCIVCTFRLFACQYVTRFSVICTRNTWPRAIVRVYMDSSEGNVFYEIVDIFLASNNLSLFSYKTES
jgi:hypothetical protein